MRTSTTTSPLTRLALLLADHGLDLDRAAPRSADHLLLQLTRQDGGTALAGQWYADPERAATVARQTDRAATHNGRPGRVRLLEDHVVTQCDGADRRLTVLDELLGGADATLVAHRPERRAVVHHHESAAGPVFTKVVRPGRAAPIARTLLEMAAPDHHAPRRGDRHWPLVPRVVAVDHDRGTVTTTALPGRTLHDLWSRPDALGATAEAMALTGQALAALHAGPVPGWAGRHDRDDELAVAGRWLDLAEAHGVLPLPRAALDNLLDRAADLIPGDGHPKNRAPLHRDLHDKQVLVHDTGLGLIDLDLLAAGDPALDVANLLVHVELRTHQGLITPAHAHTCRDAFLEAYGWDTSAARALAGYALTARLRLLGVYAFRPRSTPAAVELLTHPLFEEKT